MINMPSTLASLASFQQSQPFHHCIIDDFFEESIAQQLSQQFLQYDSEKWFYYKNPIEDKKALNDWNVFPDLTYRAFSYLNSPEFIGLLSAAVGKPLFPDNGLHGGGWHIHASGGNLNPHLDYSIHPKLKLQRKLNIIIYLSPELQEEHGGHLGLWHHDPDTNQPGALAVEVAPRFNRAILFDTTQNSWHGMSRPLTQPSDIFRKSLAVYYLCEPEDDASPRGRALFAPRADQKDDEEVDRIIQLRSNVAHSSSVYRTEE